MSKSLIFSLMANVYCRLLSADMHAKITKSRKCETRARKKCVWPMAFDRVITLK